MQILPIIPYLDNFLSSPRLGLISLNHSFGRSINSSSRFLLDVINLSNVLLFTNLKELIHGRVGSEMCNYVIPYFIHDMKSLVIRIN